MTAIPLESARPHPRDDEPLVSGDRMSRDEFERRYEAAPPGLRAELIEGVVYVASPVSETFHGLPHIRLAGWVGNYLAATPLVLAGDNSTVRLDLDNEPQPDLYLRIDPAAGGQTTTSTDGKGYVVGAPELVVEVAGSSRSIDLHAKLNAYRRNGVGEYVVVRTYDAAVDWFALRGSTFERLPLVDGTHRSERFPGLWLHPERLLAGDLAGLFRSLQEGLATPEHAAFVDRLRVAAAAALPPTSP